MVSDIKAKCLKQKWIQMFNNLRHYHRQMSEVGEKNWQITGLVGCLLFDFDDQWFKKGLISKCIGLNTLKYCRSYTIQIKVEIQIFLFIHGYC